MKSIYLLQMHSRTLPSKLIKVFTGYPYSHVGLALEKNCDVIYSFGRRKVHSILNGGFTAERKDGAFFSCFDKTVCRIFELEVTDEQYERLKTTIDGMLVCQDDYRYDMLGILPRMLGIPFTRKNRYVCSYFVADMLEMADVYKFEKSTCFIKPRDFENLENMNEIYNGFYREYKGAVVE